MLAERAPLPPLGTLVQGEPLPRSFFPAAQGAQGAQVTYTFEIASGPPGIRELPNGLEFDSARRILTGTIDDPKWPAGTYRLYYVASASGYDKARLTVSFDLEDPLRLDVSSIEPIPFEVGKFAQTSLPRAKGGTPPHGYTLEQCPLAWIELVGSELVANPLPEHAGQERLCRYRVTDAAGAFVELLFLVSAVAGDGSSLQFDTPDTRRSYSFDVGTFTEASLPQATGGSPPYTYSLEQCPLDWLELVGTELAANPRPEHAGEQRLCRYRVTDAAGIFVDLLLDVSAVAGGSSLQFDTTDTRRSYSFDVGTFTERALPQATGGSLPYTYSLEQCPLDWLELVGTELAANPRPEHAGEQRLCRYRVTDAAGIFVDLLLDVSAVAGGSSLQFDTTDTRRSYSFDVGTFTERALPEATGGSLPYTYSLEQCPLDWLELVGTELAANPRPEHAGEQRLCRYRVTDAAGIFVDLLLDVSAVAGGSSLQFDTTDTRRSYSFDVGTFTERALPEATGGSLPYTYSLEQCPLDWLELVGTELAANPRPEHAGEQRLCRYRVTDAAGIFVDLLLDVSAVAGGSSLQFDTTDTRRSYSFDVGTFTERALPEATGGSLPYTYSLEQCPLDWLELVGTNLVGDPLLEHAGEQRLCRYRVTDAAGIFVDLLLDVSAGGGGGSALRFKDGGTLPMDGKSLSFPVGEFSRRELREAIGGTPPYSYSIAQCTIDWLQLVGTYLAANPRPEHAGETHLCRYRATDSEDNFVDQVLEVKATSIPADDFQFENRHIVDRDLPVDSEIEPIVLPLARRAGMTDTVIYTLNPLLPPGLELQQPMPTDTPPTTRPRIQGTPTAVSVLTRYCLEAKEESTGATAAARCFRLRTVDHEVPRFTVNLQSDREVFLYSRVISTNVPARTGDPLDDNPAYIAPGTTVPDPIVDRNIQLPVAFLPPSWMGTATYSIVPSLAPFVFTPSTRMLTSEVRSEDHVVPTPVVYTYGVRRLAGDTLFAAAICFELGRREAIRTEPVTTDTERVWRDLWFTVTYRDEAVRTSTGEYLCHPNPRGDDDPAGSSTTQSNPVHDALGMVHAGRAVRLTHGLIGERVRDPSPGGEGAALHSDVDLARLWGRSGGFSWSGTGESLLAGADVVQPGGALRLGLVAGFHRTALDYRAEAQHLEDRYSEGEHVTEILSMHPFAAWRFATGSAAWGSVGAGAGSLWFEDDAPPFDERRRSGLELRSAALGFRHPLPSSPLGVFSFSGLAEHIALRIEGDEAEHGIRPRSLRGSDLSLGLDWRRRPADAAPSLVPSLSLGVRHQTGDGPAGSLVDVAGSIAYRPSSNPLSFDVAASTLLGVAGNDSGSWDVRASARFDPDPGPRGLELSLRSVLGAASNDPRATYGLDGELAYGLFGGAFGSTVRPYVAISSFAGASGARRTVGLRLRDEPDYRLSLETWEHTGSDAAGLGVRMNRFWP